MRTQSLEMIVPVHLSESLTIKAEPMLRCWSLCNEGRVKILGTNSFLPCLRTFLAQMQSTNNRRKMTIVHEFMQKQQWWLINQSQVSFRLV